MPITLLQPFNLDTTAAYTVTQLTATGNVTGGNVLTAGLISATGNVTGGNLNVSGNIVDTGALSIVTGSNGNITLAPNGTGIVSVLSILSATGNIVGSANVTGGNITTAGLITATGNITSTANVAGGNITTAGLVTATGNLNTSAGVLATGNIRGGNILSGGIISVTGRTFVASGTVGAPGITFSADTAQDTGFYWVSDGNIGVATNAGLRATFLDTGLSVVANVTGGNITTAGLITATGNIRGGNLISAGTITTAGNIVSSAANAVANIGSATTYFNTVHARATSAQYADVAEYYTSDCFYEPGTVVVFGGPAEVTMAVDSGDNTVAGVVSTNPAYIMNAGIQSECSVAVALTGRVPTKVIGPVVKGSMMVSAGNGHAQASATPAMGTVIGKAIENFNGTTGIIEIVVGRL